MSAEAQAIDRHDRVRRLSVGVAVLAPVTGFVALVVAAVWGLQQSLRPTSKTDGLGLLGTCLILGGVLPAAAAVLLTRMQRRMSQRRYAGITLAWVSAGLVVLFLAPPFITHAVPAEVRWRQALQQPLTASEMQDRSDVQDRLEQVYRDVAEIPPAAKPLADGNGWTGWMGKSCTLSNQGDGAYWWEFVLHDYRGENGLPVLDSVEAAAKAHGYKAVRTNAIDATTRVTVTTRWGAVVASATNYSTKVEFSAETVCVR
ncbi:hypothetical protein [Curtobacterium sp. 1544]|uniref:hypothetical protein n=1 Tax=Curtobacterium sp. 1544 TaxID=3156417 RepID=UPI0033980EB6